MIFRKYDRRVTTGDHQITLGELIDSLKRCKPDEAVRFDFCMTTPTTLDSYRGYYEDLALGWTAQENYPEPLVATFLAYLKSMLGKTVHGYKGGEYTVERDQILWVANYSDTGDTVITGVHRSSVAVIITTANTEVSE